jgi:hypothetical protein
MSSDAGKNVQHAMLREDWEAFVAEKGHVPMWKPQHIHTSLDSLRTRNSPHHPGDNQVLPLSPNNP